MTALAAGADVLIVGAGLGGLRVAERLRDKGFPGAVTMIGAEPHAPYDRPPLTKEVLRGERDSTELRAELDPLRLTLLRGSRAVDLDAARREVRTADGRAVAYGSLVLAPGAVPTIPPSFRRLPGLHVVRTIEDALRLRESATRSGRVVIVGGGFIGCEVAASLRALDVTVDLVELLDAPLLRVLGPDAAEIITRLHTRHGVRLHTGAGVAEILGTDHVTAVRLDNGSVLESADVVVGLGVSPDTGWLARSGIALGHGITCTDQGETNLPGVYALGDAAAWWYEAARAHRLVEHWTTTVDQAAVVAHNITTPHDPQRLTQVPYFWSDQYDLKIQALGFVDPACSVRVIEPAPGRTVLLYTRDGKVDAAVGFSAARWLTRLRPAVAAHAPVDEAVKVLAN
jgi:3-phenylpropionate/trans-cinnamate dioxygenase ferredoxin reductase component